MMTMRQWRAFVEVATTIDQWAAPLLECVDRAKHLLGVSEDAHLLLAAIACIGLGEALLWLAFAVAAHALWHGIANTHSVLEGTCPPTSRHLHVAITLLAIERLLLFLVSLLMARGIHASTTVSQLNRRSRPECAGRLLQLSMAGAVVLTAVPRRVRGTAVLFTAWMCRHHVLSLAVWDSIQKTSGFAHKTMAEMSSVEVVEVQTRSPWRAFAADAFGGAGGWCASRFIVERHEPRKWLEANEECWLWSKTRVWQTDSSWTCDDSVANDPLTGMTTEARATMRWRRWRPAS